MIDQQARDRLVQQANQRQLIDALSKMKQTKSPESDNIGKSTLKTMNGQTFMLGMLLKTSIQTNQSLLTAIKQLPTKKDFEQLQKAITDATSK